MFHLVSKLVCFRRTQYIPEFGLFYKNVGILTWEFIWWVLFYCFWWWFGDIQTTTWLHINLLFGVSLPVIPTDWEDGNGGNWIVSRKPPSSPENRWYHYHRTVVDYGRDGVSLVVIPTRLPTFLSFYPFWWYFGDTRMTFHTERLFYVSSIPLQK